MCIMTMIMTHLLISLVRDVYCLSTECQVLYLNKVSGGMASSFIAVNYFLCFAFSNLIIIGTAQHYNYH